MNLKYLALNSIFYKIIKYNILINRNAIMPINYLNFNN